MFVANGPIQAARLLERLGHSEMHIGLRTLAFGSVEVHTAIHGGQVGLAVGSEKGDLRGWLAAEVPAIESTLRQHDLRLDNVRFVHSGLTSDTGSSAHSDSQPRFSGQGRYSPAGFAGSAEAPVRLADTLLEVHAGLDVHA
jgi:hypothetical protein